MSYVYAGSELALFQHATHWKSYVAGIVRPYLGARVLEVGAGIGANIPLLFTDTVRDWTALEPDAALAGEISRQLTTGILPSATRVVVGTQQALDRSQAFDAILYLDVLEHIEDDAAELRSVAGLLAPGGRLVVLVPAHQSLFSPFDAAIGHYRRYSRARLRAAAPEGCRLQAMRALDSIGLFASAANRLVLRKSMPSSRDIALWDRAMVPLSRWIDPLTGYGVGKSILAVWSRD
ncbi:MAG TPA: methyltransferase domain-containing protein [Acetobacteraceae bacterium]|nr:methyltransferase domain-containing protein [Acetobacteraceae bacterium]